MTSPWRTCLALIAFLALLVACRGNTPVPTPMPAVTGTAAVPATATSAPPAPTPVAASTAPVAPITGLPPAGDSYAWWNNTVFYEVFVRSFYDGNGDGKGDLAGLIDKLDYLNDGDPATTDDLGVSGLWLMPVMASPSYHGYDVTDYYAVNPDYGTNDDFKRLMAEAHRRGIRVIVDMALNHTSNEHPWFIDAQTPGSTHDAWYIWSADKPAYSGPWGQNVWYKLGNRYYYAVFWEGMPDLNYRTPAVTGEMEKVNAFWLNEMGADGVRLDAARYLIEDGKDQADTPETHAWWKDYRAWFKSVKPDGLVVGEVWTKTADVVPYVKDQELDLAFEFDLAQAMLDSAKGQTRGPVAAAQFNSWNKFPPNQFATFLTNHDQNRVMSVLGDDDPKAKMAATLLLTAPGVPFLYYGEEVGMIGAKPDEQIRTPMQWTAGQNAGFSTGTPWENVKPNSLERNVETEAAAPDSLLNTYRGLIRLRNEHVALRTGDWTKVTVEDSKIYAFLRHSAAETLLVVINLGDKPLTQYGLSLTGGPLAGSVAAVELLHGDPVLAPAVTDGGFTDYRPLATLAPHTGYVISLQEE